jgi:hypothetical protein
MRSRSYRLRLRPTHTSTLVNATVLRAVTASTCRVFDCGLDAGDHGQRLRHLGPSGTILGPCHRSVEGAVDSAVSSARERVQMGDAGKQGGDYGHGHSAGSIELAGEGNGRPLTVLDERNCRPLAPHSVLVASG